MTHQINYCPQCASELEQKFRAGKTRPVCPLCDWIYFPDPKVAVVVLILSGKSILLVKRANTPYQGLWTLPGGFIDAGENPIEAAQRECLEETGLQVQITDLIDVLSGQEHEKGAHLLIAYQGEVQSGDLTPGDDASEVSFFSMDDLPQLAFKSTSRIIDTISLDNTQNSRISN